jgi:hypothetical protein
LTSIGLCLRPNSYALKEFGPFEGTYLKNDADVPHTAK